LNRPGHGDLGGVELNILGEMQPPSPRQYCSGEMKMNSCAKVFCLIGGLILFVGASPDGCQGIPGAGVMPRNPPVIIPTTPQGNSFSRAFVVDWGGYPETQTITWDFGDGSTMPRLTRTTGKNVSHQYATNGTFNVSVMLFDAGDPFSGTQAQKIATGNIPITIVGPNIPPVAAFVFDDTLDDEGAAVSLSVHFDASLSRDPDAAIVRYDWLFGDGETDSGKVVDHLYSRSGRYSVRLTVTDSEGTKTSVSRTVPVNSLPTAAFTFASTSDDGLTFEFDGGSSSDPDGEVVAYSWDFGDGSPTGVGQIVSHTYDQPDDYIVKLTVNDEFGASNSSSQTVDVTGTEVFVRSIDPTFGVVDTDASDIEINGENFETGANVVLNARDGATLLATNVRVDNANTIRFDVDLTSAELGNYTVTVANQDNSSGQLDEGFRVVTPDRVRLVTTMGDIVFQMVDDAPITTENFLQYVDDGFYNGTIFHRVVPNFVVQGGGFLPGMVEQTPLRPPIQNEFSPDRSNLRATVAMAKRGDDPNSATSQFFVNLADNSENLDNQNGGFTVFANVVEGMDVVDAIAAVPLNNEAPVTDVILTTAERE
jgi:cyclophilin family peptidyl-prolyl cis-trans isomerase